MNGYLGEIRTFGFNFAPTGTAQCNGQTMNISQNQALFSLLGTIYGGNGVQTFQLPNLQSRVPVHMGTGLGLSTYVIGQMAGDEQVTLVTTQMPTHTHAFSSTSALNALNARSSTAQASTGSLLARAIDASTGGTATPQIYAPAGTAGPQVALGGLNIAGTNAPQGGSQPHTNLQPYLAVNFCINLNGNFPSRN
jgi:microcystin-dependent protein|uniref:phage tail protein n=1 Tax=uncultured Sphingomonas sp. TaxID=158754 RepID=UPI0035CB1201